MFKFLRVFLIFLTFFLIIEVGMRVAGKIYLAQKYPIDFEPDAYNIVCLGESSTAGLWVDFKDSYPKQLEAKLRDYYKTKKINVIVPPHIGQNTSQVSNRISNYLDLYKPKVILLMVGVNNEWSLAESHILEFLDSSSFTMLKVKVFIFLDKFRVFKLLRFLYLKAVVREESVYMKSNPDYIWGHPELVRSPPAQEVYSFALQNREAFIKLWKFDVNNIIEKSTQRDTKVILMTYPINQSYLPLEEFISMATHHGIPLIRNDENFKKLGLDGKINDYLFDDHWHPNEKGYKILANEVFEYFVKNNLISHQ